MMTLDITIMMIRYASFCAIIDSFFMFSGCAANSQFTACYNCCIVYTLLSTVHVQIKKACHQLSNNSKYDILVWNKVKNNYVSKLMFLMFYKWEKNVPDLTLSIPFPIVCCGSVTFSYCYLVKSTNIIHLLLYKYT